MRKKYTGSKPCPCCGKVVERWYVDQICGDCEKTYNAGKKALAEAGKNGEFVALNISAPNVSGVDRFVSCFKALALSINKPNEVPTLPTLSVGYTGSYQPMASVVVRGDQGAALVSLMDSALSAIKESSKKGFEDGSNLLFGLNSGKLSMKDFEQRLDDNKKR